MSINEALVNKINLMQEKERSRLKEKDSKISTLLQRNLSARRLESPVRRSSNNPYSASKKVYEDLGIEQNKAEKNKYNNRTLNVNILSKEVDKQKK